MNTTDSVLADYDDAPDQRIRRPLPRMIRAAGALSTLLIVATFCALYGFGIVLPFDVYLGGAFVSLATIPLIMLFWAEEIAWKGQWLSVTVAVAAVSVLTWVAEAIVSAFVIVMAVVIFGK